MSQAPTPLETTLGYSPPTATQFSVFLSNKVGKLLDLVQIFDAPSCQLSALAVHEASDHAVVRLITTNSKQAKEKLKGCGFPFAERDVLIVELSGGHTLASLCVSLLGVELSIHFAYALMLGTGRPPTIALSVDDITLAGQILRRKEFKLLGEADLREA